MAFIRDDFSVRFLNQSKTPSAFDYKTEDDLAAVTVVGYFNDIYDIVKVNDNIVATLDVDATPTIKVLRVSANADKVVTVVDAGL